MRDLLLALVVLFTLLPHFPASARPIICIDPGHPSETSDGKWKGNGTSEVGVAWTVAKELAAELGPELTVVLTKARQDEYVTNRQRAEIANTRKANLLLRLHCDTGNRSGFSVYWPDRPGTVLGVTGPSREVMRLSALAARSIHAALKSKLNGRLGDLGLLRDKDTAVGAKQGALTGSVFSAVPTVLVEMVRLQNRKDAEFVKNPAMRRLLLEALAAGVRGSLAVIGK